MRRSTAPLLLALAVCLGANADVIEPRGSGQSPARRDLPPGAFSRPLAVAPSESNISGQWACEPTSLDAGVPTLIVDGNKVTVLNPRFELGDEKEGVRPLRAEVWKGSLTLVPQGRRRENQILSLGKQVEVFGAKIDLTEGSARDGERLKKDVNLVQYFAGFEGKFPDMMMLDEQVCVRVGYERTLARRLSLVPGAFRAGAFEESPLRDLPDKL